MELLVGHASPRNAERIAEIEKQCFSVPVTAEQMSRMIVDNIYDVITVTYDGVVAGYGCMSCILDEGSIYNIAVDPEFRRSGIGTAVMQALDEDAQQRGLSFLTLEVRESNLPAIALYKKMGYSESGKIKNYYSNPKETAVIYTKRFKETLN